MLIGFRVQGLGSRVCFVCVCVVVFFFFFGGGVGFRVCVFLGLTV